jgi:hypothetical protein
MDQNHVRSTKRALRQKRRELTIDHSRNWTWLCLTIKHGKATGFHGVYPEFIKKRTKDGLSFLSSIFRGRAVLNKLWLSHHTYKLDFNSNSKQVRCFLISLLRTILFEEMMVDAEIHAVLNCRTICYRIVSFKFFLVSIVSRWRRLNNGLPQGSA